MRLIDADTLMYRFQHDIIFHNDQHSKELINEAPTIQVTPHGAWIKREDNGIVSLECSKCGKQVFMDDLTHACFGSVPKRCPYCGAELEVWE